MSRQSNISLTVLFFQIKNHLKTVIEGGIFLVISLLRKVLKPDFFKLKGSGEGFSLFLCFLFQKRKGRVTDILVLSKLV